MNFSFLFPSGVDHGRIVAALRAAELKTSGEIRVLIARHRAPDPVAAAKRHFERMGMTGSRHRNGILILIAPRSRTFAVVGDEAVHARCGDSFWTELAAAMTGYFRRGEFTEGIVHGIEKAGTLLEAHFPPGAEGDGRPRDSVSGVD